MLKNLYAFLLVSFSCLLFVAAADAQPNNVDSLKKELAGSNLPGAGKVDRWVHMGQTLSALGQAYYKSAMYDSARYYFLVADSLYGRHPSTLATESAATNKADLANVELVHSNYAVAIKWYLEAIEVTESASSPDKWKALGNLYGSVGTVYNDMEQYDKAVSYDLKGLEAHRKEKDDLPLTAYMELYVAEDYINLKNFARARKYLSDAAELVNKVSTVDLYQKLYDQWGRLYQRSGHLDSAAFYYHKALQYAQRTGSRFTLMDNLRMLAFCYRDMKDYPESKKYLDRALQLSRDLRNKRLETELLKNLGKVAAAMHNNAEAVRYYQQYVTSDDSLNQKEIHNRINEIEGKYQSQKKQDSILLLQKSNQLQVSELHKKKALNWTLIGGCAALFMLLALMYRNFKNENKLLRQSEELSARRIRELESERQLVAMQSVLLGQEEERSRLARDLHDGVGGLLSGVKLSLSAMKGNVFISEENAASVNRVILQLDESIGELRRVSHNMMPEALIRFGLKEALENYCENLNLSGVLKVQFLAYRLDQRMEQGTEIIIYRIVQELLNNVVKHAQAKNVLVQLVREDKRFTLTVEDDGKGFDVPDATKQQAAGLANIRARAGYLDGSMDIRSVPGQGTSVHIEGSCS